MRHASFLKALLLSVFIVFAMSAGHSQTAQAQSWMPEDKLEELCNAWNVKYLYGTSPVFFDILTKDVMGPDLLDFGKLGWLVMNPTNSYNQKAAMDLAKHYWKTPRFYLLLHRIPETTKDKILTRCLGNIPEASRGMAKASFLGQLQASAYTLSIGGTIAAGVIAWKAGLGRLALLPVTIVKWLFQKAAGLSAKWLIPLITQAVVRATMDPSGAPFLYRMIQQIQNLAGWQKFVMMAIPILGFASSSMAGEKHEWMESSGKSIVNAVSGTYEILSAVDDVMTVSDLDQEFRFYLSEKVKNRQSLTWREAGVILASQGEVLFDDLDRDFALRQRAVVVEKKIQERKCLSEEELDFALNKLGYGTMENLDKKYQEIESMQKSVSDFLTRIQKQRDAEVVDPQVVMKKVRTNPSSMTEKERRFLIRTVPVTHYSASDRIAIQKALVDTTPKKEDLSWLRANLAQGTALSGDQLKVIGHHVKPGEWTAKERAALERAVMNKIVKEWKQ